MSSSRSTGSEQRPAIWIVVLAYLLTGLVALRRGLFSLWHRGNPLDRAVMLAIVWAVVALLLQSLVLGDPIFCQGECPEPRKTQLRQDLERASPAAAALLE
ncbi:MAG: hypothetical protein KDI56_06275 [Xanthomonadales bacterium]|nr:hypothetical protein [Xanthomonadales bacterium]MCB1739059.1 hypothetical protein [Gammaproteobacteria bacterium]